MKNHEAAKIIEAYKTAIAKGTEGGTILRRSSILPFSKAKIKYAYYVLFENLTKSNELSNELCVELISTYSLLNTFVDDNTVQKYVKIHNDWQVKKSDFNKNKKDESAIKQYLAYTHTLRSSDLFEEINDYVNELKKA